MSYPILVKPTIASAQQRIHWGEMPGSSLGLAVSEIAIQHPCPLMVITPDTPSAIQLEYECRFFLKDQVDCPILPFPDWETLAYDTFSPHQDIISQRLNTLHSLLRHKRGIMIVPISTLLTRIAPVTYLMGSTFVLDTGDRLDGETLRTQLTACGYHMSAQVLDRGEFSIRGSIIDIYPMGATLPYRIDLFDSEVESIRTFDPESQRSIDKVDSIRLLPAKEFPTDKEAISRFRQEWRSRFGGRPSNYSIYQDVSDGIMPPGIEYYLPLFFDETATLFDYLPEDSFILYESNTETAVQHFWQEVAERHDQMCHDISRPIIEPERLFLSSEQLFAQLKMFRRACYQLHMPHQAPETDESNKYKFAFSRPPLLPIDAKAKEPLKDVNAFLANEPGRVLLCAETAGRREILLNLLAKANIHPKQCASWQDFVLDDAPIAITVAPLDEGLSLTHPKLHLITESQLFGQKVLQRRSRKIKQDTTDTVIKHLAELQMGSPVVHIDFGVGRYQGLKTLDIQGKIMEFLALEYAGDDKLYVPVSSLHLINHYTGVDPEHAPLHKLGTDKWSRDKEKAAKRARDVAAELLEVYAKREARVGCSYPLPKEDYIAFANDFPFEETPDQEAAIQAVIQDLCDEKPMDRLICGDVGFGKTEVAMRAAFVVVQNDKQVAVLVPTTLLAQQHYETLCDRFADWPIRVEVLSRFKTKKEQDEIIHDLKLGKVDIVVGTHKLLNTSLNFPKLGLLIIDEEHRFGVQQKEKFKALRSEVDILTLTATPIPRTLNLSLSGMRDLSIIATPPAKRLAIKTFVREKTQAMIREAILREIHRGGQVYFVHNEVESIERTAQEIEAIVPEARITIGHGQMRERELEMVMRDFYHRRYNVLVCTTIIETGIDIPTANTIIINKADRFGLAQLHQLRGRVGRSHHQAYAYLFVPPQKRMTTDAKKRLEAISTFEELGSGFMLATHDLEIRGAGELLGEEQSGNMHAVGFSLYMELLERAVNSLKEGKDISLDEPDDAHTEIELHTSALIPEDFIPDIHTRLIMYKRISSAKSDAELDELQVEMIDRFGLLPDHLKNLFAITSLKLEAAKLGIKRIDFGQHGGYLEFIPKPPIDPMKILVLVQRRPNTFRFDGQTKLKFLGATHSFAETLAKINDIMAYIKGEPNTILPT